MQNVKDIDEYISNYPKDIQIQLKELRKIIKSLVPQAEEKISYGIPYFGYKGRLVYFGAFKNHISLFLVPPIVEEHSKELKDYKRSKSGINFPFNKKLPTALIKKLIKAGVKKNEDKQ